jgi:transmembrane sensor
MWDARLRAPDCTDEDRERFATWRDADPGHREAFERLQTIVATLRHDRGRADVRALRDEALRAVQRRSRRVWAAAVAASFLVGAIGVLLWNTSTREWLREPAADLVARLSGVETYSTGTGQRSTFVLEDGSSVELNSQSRIDVRFSKSQRHVELAQGQALFSVAKNRSRPFVVDAANRHIVAVGTQFDVRLDERSLQVTLVEGKVRVEADRAEASTVAKGDEIELTSGRQLIATLPAPARANGGGRGSVAGSTEPHVLVRDIDVAKVTAWRDGRIFLDDVSLEDAIREMNKHSAVQIRLEAAALADLHVNGMFKAGGQQSFVTALEAYFPIAAQRRGDREIVLTAR